MPVNAQTDATAPNRTHLLQLPAEIIDAILEFLVPLDLIKVSKTCRLLRSHAKQENFWRTFVQANVPGSRVTAPYPFQTFRELYAAHDPRWFLARHKIWFCNRDLTGKLAMVRFDPRRGCIEGYQVVARRPLALPSYTVELDGRESVAHPFDPEVGLHLDKPLLQFDPRPLRSPTQAASRFAAEVPLSLPQDLIGVHCVFRHAQPLGHSQWNQRFFPYDEIWPPPTIPSLDRVPGYAADVWDQTPPRRRADISQTAFYIRQWFEMPQAELGPQNLDEIIVTFSTLHPKLYTPTEDKPWRGIWVGDYSAHGCEFLLVHQPESPAGRVRDAELPREEGEDEEAWQRRKKLARVYEGELQAIKLTGDPNVPRGEISFLAGDLSQATEAPQVFNETYEGARVVDSMGHVAEHNYRQDSYCQSRLFLLNNDTLAQHWVPYGHISFFRRVDIDQFLTV